VTVENTSGSAFASARALQVTSDFPQVSLAGSAQCGANYLGMGELTAVAAVFEEPGWFDTTTLWNPGGASVHVIPEGHTEAYPSFDFTYAFPTGAEDQLVSLGLFQPSEVVESALETYVSNGGTAEDYLREDHVIAVPLTLYLSAICVLPSNGQPNTSSFHAGVEVTAYVLHVGDTTILDPLQVVVQSPDAIQAPQAPKRQRTRGR
jgi:hypothetical protein